MKRSKIKKLTLKERFREIFFGNSIIGKRFDISLSIFIFLSILVIIFESITIFKETIGEYLFFLEILFTILFTIEYVLRIYSANDRKAYIFSFYGIVDLVSILPLYLGIFFPIARAGASIRILRIFRLFRFLKMFHIVDESNHLGHAIKRSLPKVFVFVITVFFISIITGSLLSIIEQGEGFDNMLEGIYFSVNILTTVGYTDVMPVTILGKLIVGIIVLIGYGIIAVPTGIVTIELINMHKKLKLKVCGYCNSANEEDSNFCKKCGTAL